MKPKINGKKKLIVPGKKEIKSLLKNELTKTIDILRATKTTPVYRKVLKLFLSGCKKFNLFIIFL